MRSIAALAVLRALIEQKTTLAEAAAPVTLFPQRLINVPVQRGWDWRAQRGGRRRGARGGLVARRRRTRAAAAVGDRAGVARDGRGARARARRRARGNARARDRGGGRTGTLMRVVITGGAGFLGSRLARAILERGSADRFARAIAAGSRARARRRRRCPLRTAIRACARSCGSLARSLRVVDAVITPHTDSVFHLAAVVSGQAEADFDIGMRVNVDATRSLLERCRALRGAAEIRVRELARGVRRNAARSRARRRARDAAIVVRHAEGDRRTAGERHEPQGLHRRPLAAPADDRRAPGQAEPGRLVVCERHHPRAVVAASTAICPVAPDHSACGCNRRVR